MNFYSKFNFSEVHVGALSWMIYSKIITKFFDLYPIWESAKTA